MTLLLKSTYSESSQGRALRVLEQDRVHMELKKAFRRLENAAFRRVMFVGDKACLIHHKTDCLKGTPRSSGLLPLLRWALHHDVLKSLSSAKPSRS